MTSDYLTTAEIFRKLSSILSSHRFLRKDGLGNEVPFFICPFNPLDQVEIEKIRKQLINQLRDNQGIVVLDINLYDLAVSMLKDRNIWNKILTQESSIPKNKLKETLANVLEPETRLIPRIADEIASQDHYDILFLSGIGEIYPYIRSHTVLNNLQSTAKQQPTVMFFPGKYTQSESLGASLDLFGRLKGDKYYRAFNILSYTV